MAPRLAQLVHYRSVPARWARSAVRGRRQRAQWEGVQAFCLFVGHSRSGTTLLGALLAAHPDASVANELDVVRHVQLGFRRDQLFHLIVDADERVSAAGRVGKSGRSYAVPGGWQGKVRDLRVIGDKKAGNTANRLARYPELLDRLRTAVGIPIRMLYVTRNPYDTITTMTQKSGRPLEFAIDRYFEQADTVERVRAQLGPEEFRHVRYEALTDDPRATLAEIATWLGLDVMPEWLDSCAAVVRPPTSRRRLDIDWPDTARARVAEGIVPHPALAAYTYD